MVLAYVLVCVWCRCVYCTISRMVCLCMQMYCAGGEWMCVFVQVCVQMCVCTQVPVCTDVCMHAQVYVRSCRSACLCVCAHMCVSGRVCVSEWAEVGVALCGATNLAVSLSGKHWVFGGGEGARMRGRSVCKMFHSLTCRRLKEALRQGSSARKGGSGECSWLSQWLRTRLTQETWYEWSQRPALQTPQQMAFL